MGVINSNTNIKRIASALYLKGWLIQRINFFHLHSARPTGAERGIAGADGETGSRLEEHPGSDGEEDSQSGTCRGGEAQGTFPHCGTNKRYLVLKIDVSPWNNLKDISGRAWYFFVLSPLCISSWNSMTWWSESSCSRWRLSPQRGWRPPRRSPGRRGRSCRN